MPEKRFILRRPFPYTYRRYALFIIFINFLIYGIRFLYPNLAEYVHYYGAMNPVLVEQYHMYWQFLTYMFVHGNFQHIFFNMLALLIFGMGLERAIGSREFLLFYLITGMLGGFFSFLVYRFTGQYQVFLLGASGAVYALLFAYAVFIPAAAYYVSSNMSELDQVKGQAFVTSAITIGGVFSNLISGVILDNLGIKQMLITGTVVAALGAVITFIAFGKKTKKY